MEPTLLDEVTGVLRGAGYGRAQADTPGFTVTPDHAACVYVAHADPVYPWPVTRYQWRYHQALAFYRSALVGAGYVCDDAAGEPHEVPALVITRSTGYLDQTPSVKTLDPAPAYVAASDFLPPSDALWTEIVASYARALPTFTDPLPTHTPIVPPNLPGEHHHE